MDTALKTDGILVLGRYTQEECHNGIKDLASIWRNQPYKKDLRAPIPDADSPEFLPWAKGCDFSSKELKRMYLTAPLHQDFGAPADHEAFHTKMQWKARTDKVLSQIFKYLMGVEHAYFTIDRCIIKLPGKGEHEFLHSDGLPREFIRVGYHVPEMSGKVCFNPTTFVYVHGSASPKWWEEFFARCPAAREAAAAQKEGDLFNINPKWIDYFPGGRDSIKVVELEAGDYIAWHPFLLHGVQKNPATSSIRWGFYLGFLSNISHRDEYYEKTTGLTEAGDRLRAWALGCSMTLYPSGMWVEAAPRRYLNYHVNFWRLFQKLEYEKLETHFHFRTSNSGREFLYYLPPIPEHHTPCKLDMESMTRLVGAANATQFIANVGMDNLKTLVKIPKPRFNLRPFNMDDFTRFEKKQFNNPSRLGKVLMEYDVTSCLKSIGEYSEDEDSPEVGKGKENVEGGKSKRRRVKADTGAEGKEGKKRKMKVETGAEGKEGKKRKMKVETGAEGKEGKKRKMKVETKAQGGKGGECMEANDDCVELEVAKPKCEVIEIDTDDDGL